MWVDHSKSKPSPTRETIPKMGMSHHMAHIYPHICAGVVSKWLKLNVGSHKQCQETPTVTVVCGRSPIPSEICAQ